VGRVTSLLDVTVSSGPATLNYEIRRGDPFVDPLTFVDTDALDAGTVTAIDLTAEEWAGTWRAAIKRRESDPDSAIVAEFAIDLDELDLGVLPISLTGTQTRALDGVYVWDLQLTYADAPDDPITYLAGTILVSKDVTP
jgi:hypothetical protein